MPRLLLTLAAVVATAAVSVAHFVYVVPAKDGKSVVVVFSDSLDPDENVPVEKIAGLKLTARTNGKDAAVECKADKHSLTANFPEGTTLAFGTVTYGLLAKGDKPSLLVYHPKAVLGGATAKAATVGEKAALEVVPVTTDGKTKFRLLAGGKPVADAEGSVLLPDGKKETLKTDADGHTAAFAGAGQFAVWLRHTEAKAGEIDGKKYDEVKHYATLVVDVK
jgi:uncharacterized GH25 family protein